MLGALFQFAEDNQAIVAIRGMDHADQVRALEDIREAARSAYAAQGLAAFDYPKSAAAAHEAAHAVEYKASVGIVATSVKIGFRRHAGQRAWIGITDGTPAWHSGPDTSAEDDLAIARHQIAGVAGEMLLEGSTFRLGSSLDEVALFRMLVAQAGFKMGLGAEGVMRLAAEQLVAVTAILKRNTDVHRALARRLMRDHAVRGRRLARMLAATG